MTHSEALQKEQLSLAHMYTIASKEKLLFDQPRIDIDSVDILFQAIDIDDEDVVKTKPRLDIQVKATTNLESDSGDRGFSCLIFQKRTMMSCEISVLRHLGFLLSICYLKKRRSGLIMLKRC